MRKLLLQLVLGLTIKCLDYMGNLIQPIKHTTQIWVVMHHWYGISVLISQMSFGRETSGSVAKCRLFSRARFTNVFISVNSGLL